VGHSAFLSPVHIIHAYSCKSVHVCCVRAREHAHLCVLMCIYAWIHLHIAGICQRLHLYHLHGPDISPIRIPKPRKVAGGSHTIDSGMIKAFRSLPRSDPAEFCREWKKLLRIQALNSPNTGIVQDVSTKCTRNMCITALSLVDMQRDHTHKCVTSNMKTSHDINMLLMCHAALSVRHVVLCVHGGVSIWSAILFE